MRRQFILIATAILLLALPLLAQDGSKDQILTTPHNLIGANGPLNGNSDGNNQVCVFCHIPHQLATDNRTLLWNHQFGATTTYTPYSSATLDAAVTALNSGDATQLKSEAFYSLACLSCHDGQTAINTVYRVPMGYTEAEGAPGTINGAAFSLGGTEYDIGTDLSNDHPVNFTYDTSLATSDKGLFDPAGGTTLSGLIKSVRPVSYGAHGEITQPILFNNTLQCASCHNPHNETNDAFLRVDNAGSALCLKCHATT